MAKILGLDLGTNSIGWALVDDERGSILGMGTRIFQEGVINLGDGEGREISRNASRTAARSTRRQFFRRRLRKKLLLKELSKIGWCPLDAHDIKLWNESGKFPEETLREWFAMNPYALRNKALLEKISLLELGRIFYHLAQRRGFLSNSRSASASGEAGVIFDGKDGKIGIHATEERIADQHTLGAYLHSILPEEGEVFQNGRERVRNRYTTRQMYMDEFDEIWKVQATYHPELTDATKLQFGGRKKDGDKEDGILFYQRPLRSQKHLVGKCSFEPTKTKCPSSAVPFERFRVYQWVNTVECNLKRISPEEREKMAEKLFSKEKMSFKELRKVIGKEDSSYQFNYKDDDSIVGTHTISNLSNKKFFGTKWFEFTDQEQDEIWHVLYFFDDREKLKEYARTKWGFDDERADKISRFNLKEGYSSLSRKAIHNILPFLIQGLHYDIAVAMGGVKNAFGEGWKDLKSNDLETLDTYIYDIVRSGTKGGYIEPLKEFLVREFHLNESHFRKLYHHSSAIGSSELLDRLPISKEADKELMTLRNPIVTTALFELRKVVNELIDDYGRPDQIKIELARDLKVSKSKRNEIRREQNRLEKENDRVKKELERLGKHPSHDNLLKYKLWEECNKTCPYTGLSIGVEQLFSGEVQIEHIHPWRLSLNDSFMNKTLCFASENIAKGKKTPYEYYNGISTEKWEAVKAQALSCFKSKENYRDAYKKFKHFVKTKMEDDFISRQLNDTRYISREAGNYLQKICGKVMVSPGQATANLRHHWGLNTILNTENSKSRDDHRHHAVDALVLACTNRSHLQELAAWNSYGRTHEMKDFKAPWENFRKDAEQSVHAILVSHRKHNPVLTERIIRTEMNGEVRRNLSIAARGQLHMETVYGKRRSPDQLEDSYHVRKPIEGLSTYKQVEKVVDPVIRKLIHDRVEAIGGYDAKGNIPKGAFFAADENGLLQPMIFLPNKNGESVPVRKVRMRENLGNAEPLKEDVNKYVNPRNNHHVLIYEDEKGNLREDVVTLWTVVERKRQKQPIFQLPEDGVKIITTLQTNDQFFLGLERDQLDNVDSLPRSVLLNHLYRVQKFTSGDYYFRKHVESTLEGSLGEAFQYIKGFGEGKTGWKTFNPIKVRITPTGKIERLNQ